MRVAGSQWSPQSYAVREFLSRNQVPYQWIDIDQDEPARELVRSVAGGLAQLPVVGATSDDPSGMNIATTFDIRRNAMKTTLNAIGDAKNLMATAEGGLSKIQGSRGGKRRQDED